MSDDEQIGTRLGKHRYGLVLLLLLLDVFFVVIAPDGSVSRLIGLGLQGVVLVVVVVTSGYQLSIRRWAVAVIALVVLATGTIEVVGDNPPGLVSGLVGLLILVTLVEMVRGMTGLLRQRGVTVQAIAGGIAIYLLLGMLFAGVIGLIAAAGSQPYFAQGYDGTTSEHVYFSFTSMTTTGFGDLSPATQPGRAIAVMEMLIGQIYLVTVISLLVARARPRSGRADPS